MKLNMGGDAEHPEYMYEHIAPSDLPKVAPESACIHMGAMMGNKTQFI